MAKSRYQYQKVAPRHARTGPDGFVYDSKTEKDRGVYLQLLEKAGEIKNLERQKEFVLESAVYDVYIVIKTKKGFAKYKPDFVYLCKHGSKHAIEMTGNNFKCEDKERWFTIIEDVKHYEDEASKLRIRVFEAFYNTKVYIIKRPKGGGWKVE